MADEPTFPSPDEAKRRHADTRVTPTEPSRPKAMVQRPEPVPESKTGEAETPKLTPEEVRALLAVNEVNRPKQAMIRRGKVIAVPTIILSVVSHIFLSYWYVAVGLLVAGAVVWTVGPWRKRRDEWS